MELEAKIKVIYDKFFSMNNESSNIFAERGKIIIISFVVSYFILEWSKKGHLLLRKKTPDFSLYEKVKKFI